MKTLKLAALLLIGALGVGGFGAGYLFLKWEWQKLESDRAKFEANKEAEHRRLESEKAKFEASKDSLYRQIGELKAKLPKEDLQYVLLRKELIKGELVPTETINTLNNSPELKRVAPQYLLYFKGVHTDKEYPAISVRDTIYNSVKEGSVFSRDELLKLKS